MAVLPWLILLVGLMALYEGAVCLSLPDFTFFAVFVFRYYRFLINTFAGIFLYRPARSDHPKYKNGHVTVIIPTVAPNTDAFMQCCKSVLSNVPRILVIVTVGVKLERDVNRKVASLKARFPETQIIVTRTEMANKRRQIVAAAKHINPNDTPITVCVDDHVYWKPDFLKALMPAFDNPQVGLVGTGKKVIRNATEWTPHGLYASFTNFIACLYLERDNFRIRSEPYVDGAVFCVSGRTSAIRTEILKNEDYQHGYSNERFFFGMFGPLNPDDDNYTVRWILRNGWKLSFQLTRETQITTPLGETHKFCLRHRQTYVDQPWSVYAIYISQMLNLAIIWDPLLLWTLTNTSPYNMSSHPKLLITAMLVWIFFSKMVKIAPHFCDHPRDIKFIPLYLVFCYSHSFIKFYCGVTFYNHSWGGRDLKTVEVASTKDLDKGVMDMFRPLFGRGLTGFFSDGSTPAPTPRSSFSAAHSPSGSPRPALSPGASFNALPGSHLSATPCPVPNNRHSSRAKPFLDRRASCLGADNGYFSEQPAEVVTETTPLPLADTTNRPGNSVPVNDDKNKRD